MSVCQTQWYGQWAGVQTYTEIWRRACTQSLHLHRSTERVKFAITCTINYQFRETILSWEHNIMWDKTGRTAQRNQSTKPSSIYCRLTCPRRTCNASSWVGMPSFALVAWPVVAAFQVLSHTRDDRKHILQCATCKRTNKAKDIKILSCLAYCDSH